MSQIIFKLDPEDRKALAEDILKELKPLVDESIDIILKPEEASKLLGVGISALYQWVDRARHGIDERPIPYLKAGQRLRFSRKALLKWLENR